MTKQECLCADRSACYCVCRSNAIMSILKIYAREIFDSRGNPTVEVDLYTKKGTCTPETILVASFVRREVKK